MTHTQPRVIVRVELVLDHHRGEDDEEAIQDWAREEVARMCHTCKPERAGYTIECVEVER